MINYRYVTLEQAIADYQNGWITVCSGDDNCASVKLEIN